MSLKDAVKKHIEALKDPNSEESIHLREIQEQYKIEQDILEGRLNKLENYLSKNNFKNIIERLCNEHDDSYKDRCFKNGYEPYPNNKFGLLFEYIERNYSNINNNSIPQDFLCSLRFFKGYYFAVYCGQGSFHRIYDKDLNFILQV